MMELLQKTRFAGPATDCTLLAFGLISTLYLFFDAYSFPNTAFILAVLLMLALFFAAFYSRIYIACTRTWKKAFLPVAIAVWVFIGIMVSDKISRGEIIIFDYLMSGSLQIYSLSPDEFFLLSPLAESDCTVFSIYFLIPYTLLLTWDVMFKKSRFGSLIMTIPFYLLAYVSEILPSATAQIFLFIFWMTLVIRPRKLSKADAANTGITLACFGLSAVLVVSLFFVYPQESYRTAPALISVRNQILDIPNKISLFARQNFNGNTRSGTLATSSGTVDLDKAGNPRFPDVDVMRVYSESPRDLYLRGYSASQYTGHAWLPDDQSIFEQAGIDINPLSYMKKFGGAYFEPEPSRITIEHLNGKSNYIFMPYLATEVFTGELPLNWVGDQYLGGGSQTSYRVKSYSGVGSAVTAVGYGVSFPEYRQDHPHFEKEGSVEFEGYTLHYRSSRLGPIFVQIEDIPSHVLYNAYLYYNNAADVDIISLFYPDQNPDAAYMRFIMDEYTQLPEGLDERLRDWWEDFRSNQAEGGYGNYFNDATENTPYWNWLHAARSVQQTIRDSGVYTTTPGTQPRNRDFVEYFLTESNRGYCVHFASATVAMLRAFGIPARYVEGYLVDSTDFGEDGWAYVPAENAHAWAEIWIPDYGWIPVEGTPSSNEPDSSETTEADGSQDLWAEELESNENIAADNPADDTAEDPDDEIPEGAATADDGDDADGADPGETAIKLPSILQFLSGLLICSGITAILLLLYRLICEVYRKKLFDLEDKNKAALHIYDYISRFSVYEMAPSEAAHQLALRAKFSNHPIVEDELDLLRAEFENCRQELYAALDKKKRFALWLRGVL